MNVSHMDMIRAPQNNVSVEELAGLPFAKRDDMVDALVFIVRLVGMSVLEQWWLM